MEYVCTGATLKCTMGTSCPKLKATPKNVSLTGKDQANIADYVSMVNIPSFGRCRSLAYPPTAAATAAAHGKLTPMPCVPGTCPKWKAIDKDSLICGEPALLEAATLKCIFGGTISIINPGQCLEVKEANFCKDFASHPISSKFVQQSLSINNVDEQLGDGYNFSFNRKNSKDGSPTGFAANVEDVENKITLFTTQKDNQTNYEKQLESGRVEEFVITYIQMFHSDKKSDKKSIQERVIRYGTTIITKPVSILKKILDALDISIQIVHQMHTEHKNSSHCSTYSSVDLRLTAYKFQNPPHNNAYNLQYKVVGATDFFDKLRNEHSNVWSGIIVKGVPRETKTSDKMFKNPNNALSLHFKDAEDCTEIYIVNLEDDYDYYAIAYVAMINFNNRLYSNIIDIRTGKRFPF